MADLCTPVHGQMVKFENIPVSEIDNLIAAVPRKEKEMPYEEVIAYINKKYSTTGKRPKKDEAPQVLPLAEEQPSKVEKTKPAIIRRPPKVESKKPSKVLWEGSVL